MNTTGALPSTVSSSGAPVLANGGPISALTPSSSSSWAAALRGGRIALDVLHGVLDRQTADATGGVELVDHHLGGLRAGLVGERAELAEVGREADLERRIEGAVAACHHRRWRLIGGSVALVAARRLVSPGVVAAAAVVVAAGVGAVVVAPHNSPRPMPGSRSSRPAVASSSVPLDAFVTLVVPT